MKRSVDCLGSIGQGVHELGKNWGRDMRKNLAIKKTRKTRAQWHMLIIPTVLNLREENCCTLDANLG